jgi:hypothetical protein
VSFLKGGLADRKPPAYLPRHTGAWGRGPARTKGVEMGTRREFLRTSAAVGSAVALGLVPAAGPAAATRPAADRSPARPGQASAPRPG